jgi:hypothetical protein
LLDVTLPLGGGGGAHEREAGAESPGGGRVAAEKGVEEREAGAGGEQGILPTLPFARAQAGTDATARDGKGCRIKASADFRAGRACLRPGAGTASPRSAIGSGTRVRLARITGAW